MRFFQAAFLLVVSFFLSSCGCEPKGKVVRIGIDPEWYPISFGAQQSFVNGYTEELLLEAARYTGIDFEKYSANWDSLLEGLKKKKYDAVLSSLPPYNFNQAQFDFSENFLQLGPVLIVPIGSSRNDLNKMGGELVGVLTGDPAVLVLNQHPDIILRNYASIPELLDSIANGEVEGGLLNQIPATAYVQDLYSNKLKIVDGPLTEAGLHLVSLKDKNHHLIQQFNKAIAQMEKKKKLQSLQQKWHLSN